MRKVFFYILLFIISGCIEIFEPNFDLDTSNIVITGMITDLQPAQIEIAKPVSRNAKKSDIERVSGATVILYDDQGNQEQLWERSKGYYEGISKGIVGRKYHINVHLPDNGIIISTPQLLKPCPSIDSLSLEQISYFKSFSSTFKLYINGLNINLDMNSSDTLSLYYKWTIGGTYLRFAPFGGDTCYVTMPPHFSFVLGESVSHNSNLLSKKLKFIMPSGKYAYGHSVEVTQYALTKEAYDYWKKIDDQKSNVGSVFDPPPAQILGNLNYIDNQNIPVIGFFEVSSAKKKRIFIKPTDFLGLSGGSSEFYTYGISPECIAPVGIVGFIPPIYCDDCSLMDNSTTIKPLYWPK